MHSAPSELVDNKIEQRLKMKVSYDKVIDVVLCRGSLGTVKFIGRQSTKCFISLAMFAVACEASQVDGLRLVDYP